MIHRCSICKRYTLQSTHCGALTKSPAPAKYSPEDKYGGYRRKALLEERSSRGLL